MTTVSISLVLAVSTAWFTIFLGAQRAPRLRFYPNEFLRAALSWAGVAVLAPLAVMHWYFVFALVCLAVWWKIRRERYLSAKIWLAGVSALGISLGIVFLLVAAPELGPGALPVREYVLSLGSIYLGGAVTGLACATHVLARNPETRGSVAGGVRLLVLLAFVWPGVRSAFPLMMTGRLLFVLLGVIVLLAFSAWRAVRTGNWNRAKLLLQGTAFLALAAQLFALRL